MRKYNKKCAPASTVGESWELSVRDAERSVVANGCYEGRTLSSLISEDPSVVSVDVKYEKFPILVKFIDARLPLSIQVHPSNNFAQERGYEGGKSEMWYILDCEEDSYVYLGIDEGADTESFSRAVSEGKDVRPFLIKRKVHKGDCLLIPAQTPHAIGANVLLAEVQENSDVTFRIYDYDRVDANGKPRELHRALAAQAIMDSSEEKTHSMPFNSEKLAVCGGVRELVVGESFISILVTEGSGVIIHKGREYVLNAGDSYFLPAGCGRIAISGKLELIKTGI